MLKTLFFVGKAYPHKDALLEFKSLGYELGIFRDPTQPLKNSELFAEIIELDFSSQDTLRQDLTKIPPSLAIDGLLCDYENYIIYKVIIAEHLRLPALNMESARACTDKYIMRSKFMSYDPEITPQYAFADSLDTLLSFADTHDYPLVLKPTGLVKSLLITTCGSREELITAYQKTVAEISDIYEKYRITDRTPGLIIEQFITGKMCSVAAFVDKHGTARLCDGIVELTMAKDAGYNDNFLYSRKLTNEIPPETQARIRSVAQSGVTALGMTSSPAHIEIIYNDNSAKIVEIGARIGGYRPFMYKESYGINMFEQEAKLATGDTPSLEATFTNLTAMYELFPKTTSRFSRLENFNVNNQYAYVHEVAESGSVVGPARDGYKAVAIIGVSSASRESFDAQCKEIESITVMTK